MAFTERLALLIDAKAGGAISELNKLNAEINMVNQTQTQATGITGMFERGLQKVGIQSNNTAALLKAGVAAGAASAGYAMLRFGQDAVKSTVDFANGVRQIQQTTGMTAQQASRMNAVLDDFGISTDKASTMMGRLGKNLYNNNDLLAKYGVEVGTSRDGTINLEKTLVSIASAYKASGDPAERMALLTDAFGKSGKDLIPILEQGGAAIKQMFDQVPDKQIFTQQQIDSARQYQLAMDNLNDVLLEVKLAIGNALIPALTDGANSVATFGRTITDLSDGKLPKFKDYLGVVGDAIRGFLKGSGLGGVAEGWGKLFDRLTGGGNDAAESQSRLARKQEEARAATEAAASAIASQNEELRHSIDLVYQRINADLGVEGAQLNLAEAIDKTNKVLADGNATDIEKQKAVLDSKTAIDRLVDSIRAQEVASGNADGNIQRQIETLNFLKGTLDPSNPLVQYLDGYIGRLNGIRDDITTRVNVIYDVTTMGNAAPPGIYEGPPPYPTGGFDGDIWTPFARGGIVTGPTKALIGEAGPEAVIPLGKAAGMGTTIQLVVDGRVLTQIVRDDLIRIGRANGSALGQYA